MIRAAEIVQRAIVASSLGEPWCSYLDQPVTDAVRVGNRLLVVETDDGLGWLITAYAVPGDGGEAAPVAALAGDNGDADRTLASLIRETGRPMAWKRVKPGLYRSGDYLVGQLGTGEWFSEGPNIYQCFDSKGRFRISRSNSACDSSSCW